MKQPLTLVTVCLWSVPTLMPLTESDALVPEKKREALRRYQADVKGHPPAGWVQPENKEKK